MTTRDLEIFISVAEHGNMSEAAKELYVAPSSVSQTILDIEKEYNTTLFIRMNKKLHITEKGKMLLEYAYHLIALNKEIEHRMREDIQVCIRVGATVTIGAAIVGEIIQAYQSQYPNVGVELNICHSGEIIRSLRRDELDLGLIIGEGKDILDLITVPLIKDQVLLGCGNAHEFAKRSSVMPEELTGQPFILRQRSSQMRQFYDTMVRSYDIHPKELWISSDALAQKNAVISNQGLALVSSCFTQLDVKDGRLHLLEISGLNFSRRFDLVYHRRKFINPDLKRFIDVCLDYRKNLI